MDAPFPFDQDGRLVTGEGKQVFNPAFRFGVQLGVKLRAVDDLKRGRTNGAASMQTPENLS